jgi:(1->4)-alpha-D-glucan 1-alpha-D-glucosylmutase
LNAPVATYRVQVNQDFNFDKLKQIVPYLNQLGISHIYSSPIFQAKEGSSHGYDIVDPNQISNNLGGQAAFDSLMHEVSSYGLKWMQDIVPNHQSYSSENKMIYDLLKNGKRSEYYSYFDIDWNNPSKRLKNKILAPFLNEPYVQNLKKRRIFLTDNDGLKINYNNMTFPINKQVGTKTEQEIDLVNSDPSLLDKLLSKQFYALAYWMVAFKQINYRRFFDIIDLIGVQVEDLSVLENTHRLIFELANSGLISALRVDHIDGLYDPQQYLNRIRETLPEVFLLVEKVLTDKEQLPTSWPIQGSTGYDFLNVINNLFIQNGNERQIDSYYKGFSGNTQPFSDQLYDCKKLVIETYFLGDIKNLARLINCSLTKVDRKKITLQAMQQALVELIACFPVYRGYAKAGKLVYEPFIEALSQAINRNPHLTKELDSISNILQRSQTSPQALHAIMRLQQFTGAVMAKGLEDTTFYRYNMFISANEVGGNPERLGCSKAEFHDFILDRQNNWPFSLNATSSHDTKRGEDVRARLNVISEIPEEFEKSLVDWSKTNEGIKRRFNGKLAPNRNEEIYLYQMLLGAYPSTANEKPQFTNRIKMHMIKALREAKQNSNWLYPNKLYETAVECFIEQILSNDNFMEAFLPLQQKISFYGFFNSLSQVLLKMTCPGIPDFYQGTELWDLNMVDPDNRRPVNYIVRQQALNEIAKLGPSRAQILLESSCNEKAKLYLIYKILSLRRKTKQLFDEGKYTPLEVKGAHKDCVVAFMREKNDLTTVVIAPRFLTRVIEPNTAWRSADWADTLISLPRSKHSNFTNILTGQRINPQPDKLYIKEILGDFPVSLLFGGNQV